MKKNRLLLLPFFAGLVSIIYAWYSSYPIPVVSANDLVFYHISVFYWISIPLLLVPMFVMALTTKSILFKWILSLGIVLTIFSLSYFYSLVPTQDSQYFRGLVEYFIQTKSLDGSQTNHGYYQWPGFFILADITTSVSGLALASYEFLLYALIGFLLATVLFVYGSKKYKHGGVLTVIAFFISTYYFLDYQSVAFSTALGLLFIIFMLETRQKNINLIVTELILFTGLLFTHLFVPMFFALYLLARNLIDRYGLNKNYYRNFFFIALVSYFLVQITIAKFSFEGLVANLLRPPVEYVYILSSTISTPLAPSAISALAQFFSRTVTIAFVLICGLGLVALFIKKKMSLLEKAILLTGIIYSSLGFVLNTIGYRAIPIAFIPISIGASFLFGSKFKLFFAALILILLSLFVFIPLHNSLTSQLTSQSKETYIADNFFLNHYNWKSPGSVIANYDTITYLQPKLSVYVFISPWLNSGSKANAILYTPEYVGAQLGNYASMEELSQREKLDLLYNDGSSYVLIAS